MAIMGNMFGFFVLLVSLCCHESLRCTFLLTSGNIRLPRTATFCRACHTRQRYDGTVSRPSRICGTFRHAAHLCLWGSRSMEGVGPPSSGGKGAVFANLMMKKLISNMFNPFQQSPVWYAAPAVVCLFTSDHKLSQKKVVRRLCT